MNKKDFLNEIGREKDYEVEECSVCLEEPTNPVSTRCHHVFCRKCIHSCIKLYKRCPMCNREIKNQKEIRILKSKHNSHSQVNILPSGKKPMLEPSSNVRQISVTKEPEKNNFIPQNSAFVDPFSWLSDTLTPLKYNSFEEFAADDLAIDIFR